MAAITATGECCVIPASSMSKRVQVYVFRDGRFARSDTVVCSALADIVTAAYGNGDVDGEAALQAVFGGSALFWDPDSGSYVLAA